MYETDIKILQLVVQLKSLGKIDYDYEFCNKIGLLKQNFLRIKQGRAHFTANHIQMICLNFKINANWIFGTSDSIFNQVKRATKAKVLV